MILSLIVAMGENRAIGRGGGLPWRLPADLSRFKALTMGHVLVVGRKTWDSIGRPLPGRRMVVLTHDPSFSAAGVESARSLDEALAAHAAETEVFVGGGASVYREALPRAGRIYLTLVHAAPEGDVFFPDLDPAEWILESGETHGGDDRHAFPYEFRVYVRR